MKRSVLKLKAIGFILGLTFAALTPRASAQSTCAQYGTVPINNGQYIYQQDEYGSTQTQCATVSGDSFTITSANFDQSALGISTPATYASVFWGCHWGDCSSNNPLPIQMSQLTSSSSSVSAVMPSGYRNDVTYDIWFNQTPTTSGQPNGTEVMIWLNEDNQEPYGTLVGTVALSGATWQVYVATESSWNLISYLEVPATTSVTNLNLMPFFEDAETRYTSSGAQVLEPSWYLLDIEFGFEIWDGGQGLSASGFSATASSAPVANPPSITSINPESGLDGSSVTIAGTNFGTTQGSSEVDFGTTAAAITSWSNTSIVATVPNIGAGTTGITVNGANGPSNSASYAVTADPIYINGGGGASGSFVADTFYSGGTASSTTAAINTSLIQTPVPPQAVFQTERYGPMTYTIPGFVPGSSHNVALYFAELYWTAPGQREFNVLINGTQVLTNFDIVGATGAENTAIEENFSAVANSSGQIVIQFTDGAANYPKISGIAIDPVAPSQMLTVNVAGTGTVTSSPAGISCGSVCSSSYATGTTVTLSEVPGSNEVFNGWGGACSATGACSVTMSAAESVTATFLAPNLAVSVAGTGTVTSSPAGINCGSVCNANYTPGEVVTLTATPGSNEVFAGWSGACSGTGPCSVTMNASEAVGAAFNAESGPILTVATSGGGTVTSTPAGIICGSECSASFTSGAVVTLSAVAASGSTFSGWSGACSGLGSCTVTMNEANSVTATFTSSTSTLSIDAGGPAAGGFIADTDYNGGTAANYSSAINTSLVPLPAPPQAVLQSERYGAMTYTIPGYAAGSAHVVTLYFAEHYFTAAGERQFNVSINGTQVLTNFDIVAATGGENITIEENFNAVANGLGDIVIQFTQGAYNNPTVSGIAIDQAPGVLSIDGGGPASGNFTADMDYNGGTSATYTAAVNTSRILYPVPPQAVFQTERWGAMTYTIGSYSGYAPGSTHTVTLYFAELYWTAPGQREFNVLINGTQVLTNFDIFATAGGMDTAIQQVFTATANNNGQIVVQFTTGDADQPKISGISVQ